MNKWKVIFVGIFKLTLLNTNKNNMFDLDYTSK